MKKKNKPDIDLKQIGQRLEAVRKELSMTLVALEEKVGFSKSLIAAAEKGEKKPSAVYLYGLITQFNVNINYILTGKGEMFLDRKNLTEAEKDMDDLFKLMKRVRMVKYAVLTFFQEYVKRNEDLVKKYLEE